MPSASCLSYDSYPYASYLATPENIGPLVHAFFETNRAWAGHVSIVASDGIQTLAARKSWRLPLFSTDFGYTVYRVPGTEASPDRAQNHLFVYGNKRVAFSPTRL